MISRRDREMAISEVVTGDLFLLFRDALTIGGRRVDESKRASCGLTAVRQNQTNRIVLGRPDFCQFPSDISDELT